MTPKIRIIMHQWSRPDGTVLLTIRCPEDTDMKLDAETERALPLELVYRRWVLTDTAAEAAQAGSAK